MKLIQLQYFVSVFKYQNISKAAEELFVSQPTISVSLKELEKEFNSKFFIRKNNVIVATEKGQFFYEKAIKLLEEVNRFYDDMEEYQKHNKHFRIGIPPMIGTIVFPTIFKKYKEDHPGINIEIEEYGSVAIKKAVKSGEIDLAIAIIDEDDVSFNCIEVYDTELVYCVSKNHPLAKYEQIDFKLLKDEPLILMKSDSYQNVLIKRRFKEVNVEPNISLYSTQLYTIKQFLISDNLGAFLFKEIALNNPELKAISFTNPIKIKIGLIWDKDDYLNKAAENFIRSIKNKSTN